MRLLHLVWASAKSLFTRRVRVGEIAAILSLLGLGSLCYFAGAAVMYFRLPSSEYFERAFLGASSWLELDRTSKSLSWHGLENKLIVDRPEKTFDGFTLHTIRLGGRAMLIDMSGRRVHEWKFPFSEAFPRPEHVRWPVPDSQTYWFGCHAFPNGDLLAVYQADSDTPYGYGLVKLDRDSKLLWGYAGNVHHNFDVAEDGTIYALGQKLEAALPEGLDFVRGPYIADCIVVLSPQGKELKSVPIMEAFRDSPYALMPECGTQAEEDFQKAGDYLHANNVMVLSAALAPKFPLFKAGQVLVSLRNMDALAVIDLDTRSVAWAARGIWRRQHAAQFLENGNLLVYDNSGSTRHTRVLEYNPTTQAVPWSYASEDSAPFVAPLMGTVQRLPNGNTLIVDPKNARIFEVSQGKELVWEVGVGRPELDETLPGEFITAARRYGADELTFLKGRTHARP